MLFRAQIPLALTSLVDVDDDRLLLVFECHAHGEDGGPCDGGDVVVARRPYGLADAPPAQAHDVVLTDLGANPDAVWKVVEQLFVGDEVRFDDLAPPPVTIVPTSPSSIAEQAIAMVRDAGGRAELRPAPVTQLGGVWGGRLVPYEDGFPGTRKTTLPPLSTLMNGNGKRTAMRGLFGGTTPGYRDHPSPCTCGRPTRTAVRLLGETGAPRGGGVRLGPATVQVCLACDRATLHRISSG